MRTIHKIPLMQAIDLPKGAIIHKVYWQAGVIMFWYSFDKSNETLLETRRFRVLGTGHTMDTNNEEFIYLDTLFDNNGFVWHIHEVI